MAIIVLFPWMVSRGPRELYTDSVSSATQVLALNSVTRGRLLSAWVLANLSAALETYW